MVGVVEVDPGRSGLGTVRSLFGTVKSGPKWSCFQTVVVVCMADLRCIMGRWGFGECVPEKTIVGLGPLLSSLRLLEKVSSALVSPFLSKTLVWRGNRTRHLHFLRHPL